MEPYDALEALADSMGAYADRLAERRYVAQQALITDVRDEIDRLPFDIVFEGELPIYPQLSHPPIKVFPLGAFDYAWVDGLAGRTTLYIGDDGDLYEYGPLNRRPVVYHDDENDAHRVDPNHVVLRRHYLDDLDVWELIEARYLLRRLWV